MRIDWTDLPAQVREAILAETGPVTRIDPAPTGNHAAIASTLHASGGPVFVKAARKLADQDGPEVMSLRREAAINPFVPEFAPRLHWKVEAGEWLALGFEHVAGRPADFAPGSGDLEVLEKVIDTLQLMAAPSVVKMQVERRWASEALTVQPMAGGSLLHTDLNEDNFLITSDGRAYVVDWAFVARGAAWVELGLLIPWLLKAGHSPREAEAFVTRFGSWSQAPLADLGLFTKVFASKWARNAQRDTSEDWVLMHAHLTRRWADHWESSR
ncbi:phosphotransferase family protein [Actinomadura sp. 9N407]|uniref:phosphotransferase family protein n=1 Tax=Actinomadura sp. 9N407 TaxID=3375154 RepID=UPI0037A8E6FF